MVFISYSRADRWIAEHMARSIEEQCAGLGIEAFLDERSIEGGQSIPDAVRQNIKRCDEFLILLSHSSITREWVKIELGAAWVLEKLMVPIIDKLSPRDMPDIIDDTRAIDLNNFDEQYIGQLIRRVNETRGT
jgi:hypothetical protein